MLSSARCRDIQQSLRVTVGDSSELGWSHIARCIQRAHELSAQLVCTIGVIHRVLLIWSDMIGKNDELRLYLP